MPRPIPTPLAAALGLVPTVLSEARRLPTRVVQLPIVVVSVALSRVDATRRGYDDLAERGERLIARLRGTSFDEVEDRVEDALQDTPVAGFSDRVEDAAQEVGAQLSRTGERALRAVRDGAGQAADAAADAAGEAPEVQAPAAEAPKGRPTPKATEPDASRVDTAASRDVVQTVEKVAGQAAGVGSRMLDHDELPLADYDHMTLGSLRGRLRSLSVEQLVQLRDYEKAHADRLPVVTMLDNRIAKLATDPSATLSPGGTGTAPELQPSQVAQGGSKVSPATGGPAQNPPTGGVPTNPAQPRSTG